MLVGWCPSIAYEKKFVGAIGHFSVHAHVFVYVRVLLVPLVVSVALTGSQMRYVGQSERNYQVRERGVVFVYAYEKKKCHEFVRSTEPTGQAAVEK